MSIQTVASRSSNLSVIAELPQKIFDFAANNIKRVALVAAIAMRSVTTLFHFAAYKLVSIEAIKNRISQESLESFEERLLDSKALILLGVNYFSDSRLSKHLDVNEEDGRIKKLSISGLTKIAFVYSESPNKIFDFVANSIKRVALVAAIAMRSVTTLFHFAAYKLVSIEAIKNRISQESLESFEERLLASKALILLGANYFSDSKLSEHLDVDEEYYRIKELDFAGLAKIAFVYHDSE